MASGNYNPAGGQPNAGNVLSLGYTCGSNEYPNGTISFSSMNGSYLACTAAGTATTYTFYGYICDSSGGNAYHVCTLTFNAYETSYSFSGTVSGATGLTGKALYFKWTGDYIAYLQLRGEMSVSIGTATSGGGGGGSLVASTFTAANVEFGASSKVTFSNSSLSSVRHKVKWEVGSKSYTSGYTSVGAKNASYTIPTSWMDQVPTGTYITLKITVTTYKGSTTTTVGNPYSKSYTASVPSSVVPSLTSVTATIYNEKASPLNGKYIQNITGVILTFNGATAGTGSNIDAKTCYVLTCNKTETMTQDSSNYAKFTVSKLGNNGSITFTAKIKDARGRISAAKTVTINVQQYAAPTISSVAAFRSNGNGVADENGGYITLRCNATYQAFTGNTMTINSIYYKTADPSHTSTAKNNMTSGTQYTIGGNTIDPAYSYQVKFTVTDTVGKSVTSIVTVNTAEYAIHVKNGGKGVAFGKTSEYQNAVEINSNWGLYYKGGLIDDYFVRTNKIINNLTTSSTGYVLDASRGKALSDMIEDCVVGGRVSKNVTGSSSQQTVRIDFTNGYWFMIISLPGLARVWVGLVQCTSDGTINVAPIREGSNITVETGSYRLNCKFTYSSDTTIQFVAIPIRGKNMPTFH